MHVVMVQSWRGDIFRLFKHEAFRGYTLILRTTIHSSKRVAILNTVLGLKEHKRFYHTEPE